MFYTKTPINIEKNKLKGKMVSASDAIFTAVNQ